MTVAVLLLVLLALKEKEELPVLPKAGGGGTELFWLLLAFEKLKADVTGAAGAGADVFDPAEKPKLLAGFAAGVDVLVLLVLPIPPKENGLFAVSATEFVGADGAGDAPNEKGDDPAVAFG